MDTKRGSFHVYDQLAVLQPELFLFLESDEGYGAAHPHRKVRPLSDKTDRPYALYGFAAVSIYLYPEACIICVFLDLQHVKTVHQLGSGGHSSLYH